MPNNVYRQFDRKIDLSNTVVRANRIITVDSGSTGWSGNTNAPGASLSLYAGVRSRLDTISGSISTTGFEFYPLDNVDTHTIDGVIQVPGQYPMTGSIRAALVLNVDKPYAGANTETLWYGNYWQSINLLSDWHKKHRNSNFKSLDTLPDVLSVIHIPSMFYGRSIVTGSLFVMTHAWDLESGAHIGSGTRYFIDDGRGGVWDVPASYTGSWSSAKVAGSATLVGNVFYSEGLVVFTSSSSYWHSEFLNATYNNVSGSSANMRIQFKSDAQIASMVFNCRLDPGEGNCSNNPTWTYTSGSGSSARIMSISTKSGSPLTNGTTYISAIGLYNRERQLVAVAKLAQPIRKREQDDLNIRLKFDV